MKLQTLAAACAAVITVSLAGSAFAAGADTNPIIVKLQSPLAAKTKFIAGGAVFQCEGDVCAAGAPTSQTFAASTCKTVAKAVGAVVSFGDGGRALDAGKLDSCNAVSNQQVAKR